MPAQPQSVSFSVGRGVAVGAEEEVPADFRNRRASQRQPMRFALCDRQAVNVRPNPAGKERVAVDPR